MSDLITVENLSKRFGKQQAVDSFSFELKPHEVVAFLGANGSGKTTTLRCLLGIYFADSGEALIKGKKYDSSMNQIIGYLPEERGIYTKAKVRDLFEYFASLRHLHKTVAKKIIDDYLEKVSLAEHQNKQISQLSSGMQQKVQIGITIMHRPEILILDEPFRGLDPVNRQLFLDIFADLNKQHGTSILYSTHVVDEAQKIADRVVMIRTGRRIAYGTVDEVRSAHGSNNIVVEFNGKFNLNSKLFSATVEGKTAELTPAKDINGKTVAAEEIIKELINKGVALKEFKIDRPTLNQVFIQLNKDSLPKMENIRE